MKQLSEGLQSLFFTIQPGTPIPLTVMRASEISGIPTHTLRYHARKGHLRAKKIGPTWVTDTDALWNWFKGLPSVTDTGERTSIKDQGYERPVIKL